MGRGKLKNNHGKNRKLHTKKNFKKSHKQGAGTSKKRKRKFVSSKDDKDLLKRQKVIKDTPKLTVNYSSSDTEEEENPLSQLLSTFNTNITNKIVAVVSDESEESENETADESNEICEEENSENAVESEDETEIKDEEAQDENDTGDPFIAHLSYDLSEDLLECIQNKINLEKTSLDWPTLGNVQFTIPKCIEKNDNTSEFSIAEKKIYAPQGKIPTKLDHSKMTFSDVYIKSQIHANIKTANKVLNENDYGPFSKLQSELFSIINNYQDLMYNERTFENAEEIRFIYSLHAINHVLKTRMKVIHHNARLSKKDEVPEEFRDQGLMRPKILIIVPFRDSCRRIVQILIDILVPKEKGQVINKIRFMDDFSGNELALPKKNPKPEDYEKMFGGNCDDTFKIGIQVTKKSIKLYSDFYSSDLIIASPLGLRMTVGAEGEEKRDYDFLASIELLILDQTEVFLMQNWDHLLHVFNHFHLQPKDSHGTDFSRVRTWSLNGWSKYYRQTLIFSSLALPEINSLFNKKCFNYAGNVRVLNQIGNGSIVKVHVLLPQVFRKFQAENIVHSIDARLDFFINKILPQYKDSIMKQCLIYVPNYFDYVKIRNYLKREDISFVQICEYSKDGKVARARDMFFHGDAHFLLYSERFHFFRRIRIKGIRHVIFYQPPIFPHFYSEICNFMQESYQNKKVGSTSNMTVTVLYSKYDVLQLSSIVGTERMTRMAASNKNFHMFTT